MARKKAKAIPGPDQPAKDGTEWELASQWAKGWKFLVLVQKS